MGSGPNSRLGTVCTRGKIFWFSLVASLSAAFIASPFGCGLDDTAVQQLGSATDGSFSDTGVPLDEAGKPIGDSGADVVVCDPETCNNFPSICRAGLSNGCGGTVDCTSACPNGQACIPDSGTCDGPPVCRDAGAPGGNCGELVNPGNGLDASCGGCSNGFTCNSSACGCTSTVVCAGACCGASTDVCNGTACCSPETAATTCGNACNVTKNNNCAVAVNCPATCTGAGLQCAPNTKTCDSPPTCTNMGQNGGSCGTLTNSDGLSVNCGTCSVANETCTGNTCGCASALCGTSCCGATQICNTGNNTCCVPDTMATTCTNKCGTVANNCGVNVACGNCTNGDTCEGTVKCNCGSHGLQCDPGKTCDTVGPDKCD